MTTLSIEPKPISRREFLYYVWGANLHITWTSCKYKQYNRKM